METKVQPYRCKFCQRGFTRSDTRRLHFDKCKARISAGVSVPPPARKGRKLRACDVCAQRKRACNYETPCAYCKSKGIRCHYSRAVHAPEAETQTQEALETPVTAETQYDHGRNDAGTNASLVVVEDEAPDVSFAQCSEEIPMQNATSSWNVDIDNSSIAGASIRSAADAMMTYPASSSLVIMPALRPTISRPSVGPLIFLSNFTTTDGMASLFNFSFYRSRHKNLGRATSFHFTGRRGDFINGRERLQIAGSQVGSSYNSQPHTNDFFGFQELAQTTLPANPWSETLNNETFDPLTGTPSVGVMPESNFWDQMSDSAYYPTFDDPMELSQFDDLLIWIADPLFLRTRDIWLSLNEAVIKASGNYATPMQAEQSHRCLQFFSPPNLKRFTDSFFDDWYPHDPIIHRPTFDPHTTPTILLLAMSLIGAAMSPSPVDGENAREWLDYAEDLAFYHNPEFQQDTDFLQPGVRKPSGLQAAFLMCCLQTWEGTPEAKTRIRRYKYPILIGAIRKAGFEKATHNGGAMWATDAFDWHQWVAMEELIRVFMFVWLVDTSFVIFHNSPSKIHTHELTTDLLSPPTVFQASSSALCLSLLRHYTPPSSPRTLTPFSTLVSILRSNTFSQETSSTFLSLDSVNLFCLLAALYVLPFQQDLTLFHLNGLDRSIRDSLDSWQLAWNARSDIEEIVDDERSGLGMGVGALGDGVEMWKRVGFFRHADEFRVYALGVLGKLKGKMREREWKASGSGPGFGFGFGFGGMNAWRRGPLNANTNTNGNGNGISVGAGGGIGGGSGIGGNMNMNAAKEIVAVTPFEKFDETSTDQVADLLNELQFQGLET